MHDYLILVDENDIPIGTEEKLEAHQKGDLHRAFSIFVFNEKNELLIQRRTLSKYHSGGLWANTCCSHPRPDEDTLQAAHRRLVEEMGFDCDLAEAFNFIYKANLDNNLVEHEFDHVLIGKYDGEPIPNPAEVDRYKWVNLEWLEDDIKNNGNIYCEWVKTCFNKLLEYKKNENLL
ncbi:MAG: isopentenyl-diphosphate Delta-isomerase [Candidatus Paceibacterota bacterium]|jgi:isopentenyl-diphosphate delta-isomerase